MLFTYNMLRECFCGGSGGGGGESVGGCDGGEDSGGDGDGGGSNGGENKTELFVNLTVRSGDERQLKST